MSLSHSKIDSLPAFRRKTKQLIIVEHTMHDSAVILLKDSLTKAIFSRDFIQNGSHVLSTASMGRNVLFDFYVLFNAVPR